MAPASGRPSSQPENNKKKGRRKDLDHLDEMID
jgi:hypothetical protein